MSFQALAKARIAVVLTALASMEETIGPKTVPHDPALRGARKIILKLRTQLDIFAHVFGQAKRAFRKLRNLLDWGYEAIGRFKDLFDAHQLVLAKRDPKTRELVRVHASKVSFAELEGGGFVMAKADDRTGALKESKEPLEYPRNEVLKRREEMLLWKKQMTDTFDARLGKLQSLIGDPNPKRPKRKDLSKFFWGGIDGTPSKKKSGVANLSVLAGGMIDRALDELRTVERLDTPVGRENEEVFHDFRKQLRAILSVVEEVPEVSTDPSSMRLLREGLFEVVSRYGDVETMVVGAELAKKHGKPKRTVSDLEKRADGAWKALRAWQTDSLELEPLLVRLKAGLVPSR